MGGYTPADRWICETDSCTFFVKVATTPLTAQFLRKEIQNYATVRASFMPERIAAEDHEEEPILILEDLSGHYWPPPWTRRAR